MMKDQKERENKTRLGTMPQDQYADLSTALAHKDFLTVHAAAVGFGVGINKMYTLVRTPGMDFVVWYGKQRMVSREKFKQYIMNGNLKTKQR